MTIDTRINSIIPIITTVNIQVNTPDRITWDQDKSTLFFNTYKYIKINEILPNNLSKIFMPKYLPTNEPTSQKINPVIELTITAVITALSDSLNDIQTPSLMHASLNAIEYI